MKITYDNSIKIAGLGLAPWPRLGPEQWLPSYKIASLYGWDLNGRNGVPEVIALSDRGEVPQLERLNTASLLKTPEFQRILEHDLAGYTFLPYKAVTIPAELAHRKFMMVDPSFTELFENKVEFRKLFDGKIRFPDYRVYNRTELPADEAGFVLLADGRHTFVIQDEQLSGGKGTFIVHDYQSYRKALASLEQLSKHTRVVVSDAVRNPRERTIQACVTKDGVVTGPLQRQIVHNSLLANVNVPTGDKWCGAQIYAGDQATELHETAQSIAQRIGEELSTRGYRGIFGVDFLLGEDGVLYTLEVNPRITGVTPLLAALYHGDEGVPFYLLHLLELGGFDYEVQDTSAAFEKDGALLVMHSLDDFPVTITALPRSGTYTVEDDKLVWQRENIRLHDLETGEWIIQEYLPPTMTVQPGGRILTLQTKQPTIDKIDDKLYNETVTALKVIRNHIETKAA